MARHRHLADPASIEIYSAEPHSPWQPTTNKDDNGLIRRYGDRSTNLAALTPVDLSTIEHHTDAAPRRRLPGSTAGNRRRSDCRDDRLNPAK